MAIHTAEVTLGALHTIRTVIECRSCQLASSCYPESWDEGARRCQRSTTP